jgi:hypothetical protein
VEMHSSSQKKMCKLCSPALLYPAGDHRFLTWSAARNAAFYEHFDCLLEFSLILYLFVCLIMSMNVVQELL